MWVGCVKGTTKRVQHMWQAHHHVTHLRWQSLAVERHALQKINTKTKLLRFLHPTLPGPGFATQARRLEESKWCATAGATTKTMGKCCSGKVRHAEHIQKLIMPLLVEIFMSPADNLFSMRLINRGWQNDESRICAPWERESEKKKSLLKIRFQFWLHFTPYVLLCVNMWFFSPLQANVFIHDPWIDVKVITRYHITPSVAAWCEMPPGRDRADTRTQKRATSRTGHRMIFYYLIDIAHIHIHSGAIDSGYLHLSLNVESHD